MDRMYGLDQARARVLTAVVLAAIVLHDRSLEDHVVDREHDEVEKLHHADQTEADENAAYTADVA